MEVDSEGMENTVAGTRPIEKPPEETPRKATFKEKVLGAPPKGPKEIRNLVKDGVMKREQYGGSRLFPNFDSADESIYQQICKPWEHCLVVKLLGKRIGYGILCEKLKAMWKPAGGFVVRDIHHGYFLVKFDLDDDRMKAMARAPWMIFDHYLSVKPWNPEFVAANSKINTTMLWIRIPGLGFQFYDESILMTLASGVGEPIRVDTNTVDMQRGKFARVCVEIDLDQPVIGMVGLRGTWYNVEYEGLHLLCSHCGCYGHLARNCTNPQQRAPPAPINMPAPITTPEKETSAAAEQGQGESQASAEPVTQGGIIAPGDTVMNAGANHQPSIKPLPCPPTAHGDWLVVDKRRKNSKKQNKEPSMRGKSSNSKETMKDAVIPKLVETNSLVFNAGVNTGQGNKAAMIKNGKKRVRRDPSTSGESGRVKGIPPGKVTSATSTISTPLPGSSSVTQKHGTNTITVLADGTRSILPLQHQGGSRYRLLDSEKQGQQSTIVQGQYSGVPPGQQRT
ncbi:uncharacterized protein LOC130743755 [Lotus japonicus]|uniref:uncharacterized protein LOC130743755 n=1 Tax=Lotus japonicus TaxID=34305 RepID=UPI002588E40B|nr:uncharacterized protein LOC130743755 [Lotus japonicus]